VPGDVDLVGVENEEIIATMSTPPLGSVRLGSDQIGYEAVRFLDRMIRRLKPLEPALLRRSRYWKCSVKRLASRPAITAAVFIPASDESRPARPRR
jgi:DNA-binding LacI/PurR family transcriptional regulator